MPTRSEVASAQSRAVGGAKKRCKRGKSCSATCIDPSETCLVEFPPQAAEALSKTREKLSESHTEFMKKLRDDFRDRRYKDIREAIQGRNEWTYNKARKEIIQFNDGRPEGVPDIKVPLAWERVKRIADNYDRAEKTILDRLDRAIYTNSRSLFDRELARLSEMHSVLGSKLGNVDKSKKIKWENYEGSNLLKRLYSDPSKSFRVSVNGDDVTLTSKVGKNVITFTLENGGREMSFKVNDSFSADTSQISRKDKLAIALKVKEMFKVVSSGMDEESVIKVFPFDQDGRGEKRRKAYGKAGFKSDTDDYMYGKIRNGKIVGATRGEFEDYESKGLYNWAES